VATTGPLTLAFIAHTGGKVVLRPRGVPTLGVRVPRELGPGSRLGGLAFADLAAAFRGVVGFDPATGIARIIDRAPEGAPRRLTFSVDRRGVVTLRALDDHPWRDEVPAGRPVFGLPAEALQAAREGVIELDPAMLEGQITGRTKSPPAVGSAADGAPAARQRRLLPVLTLCLTAGVAGGGWWWLSAERASEAVTVGSPPRSAPEPRMPDPAAARDPLEALAAIAASVGNPAVRADLDSIAAALRVERRTQQEERARAATAAIKAGAQLARAYRRDVAEFGRLETAAGLCGGDTACRSQYEVALGRAEAARELTRDAYANLRAQVAAEYPPELLQEKLRAVEAEYGSLDEAAGLGDLARHFVAEVVDWREDPGAGAAEIQED
jgi:hypothetical protein